MTNRLTNVRVLSVVSIALALGACGKSSSSAPPPTPGTGYTVGGSISGYTGSGLVLQNNAGDDLTVPSGATTFQFSQTAATGAAYLVTVLTQPSNPTQFCQVSGGDGQVGAENVTSVVVTCATGDNSFQTFRSKRAAGHRFLAILLMRD